MSYVTNSTQPRTTKNHQPRQRSIININLITAYNSGTIVVFDVETTGLLAGKDEVIEIAAIKLINGEIKSKSHAYIQNTVSVGDSEQIHGYSDEFLAANGKNAIDVFTEFLEFIQDAFLVGHNLGFDIKMIVILNRIRFERR
ncbi:MAG: hypothetical protein HEQ27_10145 [Dolichospermum sp. JUN01]|nr:hypothetical protein [Dolichospermum sp. JUN01]